MYKFKSDAMAWLMGFNKKKSSFPEPFASSRLFDNSMNLRLPSDPEDAASSKIGFTLVQMLRGIYGGDAIPPYIGLSDDTLCVEYHSLREDKEVVKAFAFNLRRMELYGMVAEAPIGGFALPASPTFRVAEFRKDTGTALYETLLLGHAVRGLLGLSDGTEATSANAVAEAFQNMTAAMDGKDFSDILESDECLRGLKVLSEKSYTGFKSGLIQGETEIVVGADFYKRLTSDSAAEYVCEKLSDVFPNLIPANETAPVAFMPAATKSAGKKRAPKAKKAVKRIGLDELRTELALPIHDLSDEEKAMVENNKLGDSYVVDEKLLRIARKMKRNWAVLSNPSGVDLAANILLEGDSGSGKTVGAKFFADVFGIPYTKMTMEPMMDSSTLIGAFYPYFADVEEWDCSEGEKMALNLLQKRLQAKAAASKTKLDPSAAVDAVRRLLDDEDVRAELRSAANIPLSEEIIFDPEGSWEALGETGDAPDSDVIVAAANERAETLYFSILNLIVDKAAANQVSYRFILSELMKAFQHGWLLEIQEAANVLRPGVLTQLNSLMEKNGSIELPNGKRIRRHPDTVVVITTNKGYAGNMDLNESLRDRCIQSLAMDNPVPEVMAARAMAQVGFEDESVALAAARVIHDVDSVAKEHRIKGAFGMRSLIGWLMDLAEGEYDIDTFMSRVVNKMTTNEDDIALLVEPYKNSMFASKIKRTY